MFDSINAAFNHAKNDIAEHNFIVESVLDVEEVLPGSEEEMDDEVDVDSVPDDVYAKIDKVIDKYVSSDKYDDTEAEELVDDDDYEDVDVSDEEINAIVSEAVSLWESSDEDDSDDEEDDKKDDDEKSEDDSDDKEEGESEDNDDEEKEEAEEDLEDMEKKKSSKKDEEGDVKVSDKELEQDLDLNFNEAFDFFEY